MNGIYYLLHSNTHIKVMFEIIFEKEGAWVLVELETSHILQEYLLAIDQVLYFIVFYLWST